MSLHIKFLIHLQAVKKRDITYIIVYDSIKKICNKTFVNSLKIHVNLR